MLGEQIMNEKEAIRAIIMKHSSPIPGTDKVSLKEREFENVITDILADRAEEFNRLIEGERRE